MSKMQSIKIVLAIVAGASLLDCYISSESNDLDKAETNFEKNSSAPVIQEQSEEAEMILTLVNHPTLTMTQLELDVGLNSLAAESIAFKRRGNDEIIGTSDDFVFAVLEHLRQLPDVGENAINKLLRYAQTHLNILEDSMQAGVAQIMEEHGLVNTNITFPEWEIEEQNGLDTFVPFKDALSLAIYSFYTDDEHIESPLSIVSGITSAARDEWEPILRDLMNRHTTHLAIVPIGDRLEGVYPPEHGEAIEDNWVFFMTIRDLSDHLFWAIVPRNQDPVHNYGFN